MNQYLLFFIGMALMVMAPGPDFMNVVGQSLRGSFRNGLMSAVGVVAGSCVHVTAAIVGLSAILLSSALAYEAVRWTGAAYLILLGIRSLFSRSSGESTNVSDHALSNRPINRAFRKGLLVNVLNPKAAITFMAFMPQFVNPEKGQVWLQFLMLGVITIVFACGWFCCVAAAVHFAGSKVRENRTLWQIQEKVSGCILVGLGLRLALEKRAQ